MKGHTKTSRRIPVTLAFVAGCMTLLSTGACNTNALVDVNGGIVQDSGNVAADHIRTQAGAIQFYSGVVRTAASMMVSAKGVIPAVGYFTDELTSPAVFVAADARTGMESMQDPYTQVQKVRVQANQGIMVLQKFPGPITDTLIAYLFALQGHSEVLLTELFCNGVPLSLLGSGGGTVRYTGAISRTDILDTAIAHFDSAMALAGSNARILTLARVGKGRAFLNYGKFQEAGQAVADVPTNAVTQTIMDNDLGPNYVTNYLSPVTPGGLWFASQVTIPESKGTYGMAWRSAQDPRVPIIDSRMPNVYPARNTPIVLAGGIEARLIEAEAALQARDIDTWAEKLNTLRQTAITPAMPNLTADSTTTASDARRVDVMFRERAFWLYLRGNRLGDWRRLVRQYGRSIRTLYPQGVHTAGATVSLYGDAVFLPVVGEIGVNTKYRGCLDENI